MDIPHVNRWLSKSEIVARYGITQRTLERWLKSERFPAPDLQLPGGQPRWSDALVETHERNSVGKRVA
jgi:predicted DNA-binding transcriptional regulator AlpA